MKRTTFFATRSIRRETLYYAFLACGLVLVAVGGILFAHHHTQIRQRLDDTMQSTARILAANVSVALAFRDPRAAADTLSTIRFDPQILSATLYDREGRLFVAQGSPVGPAARPTGAALKHTSMVEVLYEGEYFGSLYVVTDHESTLRRTAIAWGWAFLAAFALSTLLAIGLASRFQEAVATPLSELAKTAREVTTLKDYSLRTQESGPAEVVELARAFNTMLQEVGMRDATLARQLAALDEEIRRRKLAQETLRQNTREMLRLSHSAGMAEVATGVLHNIGNVLNSINVSTELLAEQLGRRAQTELGVLKAFFDQPPPRAEAVYAGHPDGAELRRVALGLVEHTAAGLERASLELKALRTGVEHLKDVVARQQGLARSARREETFDALEALNEAILLYRPSGVSAERLPPAEIVLAEGVETSVHADRGAVVQILVNLLANARDAVVAAGVTAPRIRVTVGPVADARLNLAVEDNGVGIEPEQLVSIFEFGYTTKEGGHGFGLHNSANIARALGGSLKVRSDGPGRGAVFTLALPVAPPKPSPPTLSA